MQRSAYSIVVATLITLLTANAFAAEFPYNAYVTAAESFAMSGPGMVGEYRTERLERGQRVTVYQQVPGWCAIRPPHGAHSWVDGRYLDKVSADTARVKTAKVPSFIGSSLQARRDKTQVALDANEIVQVVEVTETSSGTWYKIAPPAGEFRWVSSAELGREAEAPTQHAAAAGPITTTPLTASNDPPPSFPGAAANATPTDPTLNAPGQISQWQTADSSRWRNLNPGTIVSTSGTGEVIAQAPQPQPAYQAEPRNWSPATNSNPATTPSPAAMPVASSTIPLGGPSSAATAADGTMSRSVQYELEAIEYDLSAMMAQDPSAWSFATFNQRSDVLLNKATSPYERGKVRNFQNKLARFAEIKQRTLDQQSLLTTTPTRDKIPANAVAGTASPVGSPFALPKTSTDWVPGARPNNSLIATQGLGTGGPLKAPATINDPVMGRYDAIGTLARVNSSRPNAPKYALTEGTKVLAFVTPGPGVELDAYIHKQIGIIGQKGYMPELKASHITATTIGPTDPATIARMRADQKFR